MWTAEGLYWEKGQKSARRNNLLKKPGVREKPRESHCDSGGGGGSKA